jgi:hypothetical protein
MVTPAAEFGSKVITPELTVKTTLRCVEALKPETVVPAKVPADSRTAIDALGVAEAEGAKLIALSPTVSANTVDAPMAFLKRTNSSPHVTNMLMPFGYSHEEVGMKLRNKPQSENSV